MKDRDTDENKEKQHPLGSPYGPQYGHIDEAAGGADSSPFEEQPDLDKSQVPPEDIKKS